MPAAQLRKLCLRVVIKGHTATTITHRPGRVIVVKHFALPKGMRTPHVDELGLVWVAEHGVCPVVTGLGLRE